MSHSTAMSTLRAWANECTYSPDVAGDKGDKGGTIGGGGDEPRFPLFARHSCARPCKSGRKGELGVGGSELRSADSLSWRDMRSRRALSRAPKGLADAMGGVDGAMEQLNDALLGDPGHCAVRETEQGNACVQQGEGRGRQLVDDTSGKFGPMRYYGGPKSPMWRAPAN